MPKQQEVCYSCGDKLPDDNLDIWFGESGYPYCCEDCMNDEDDAPIEDEDSDEDSE